MRLAQERRRAARIDVARACRVRRQAGLAFGTARTINMSTGGALLEVDSTRPIAPGERLAVAVAWDSGPLVGSSSFVPARVIRATEAASDQGTSRRQQVAIQFEAAEAALAA